MPRLSGGKSSKCKVLFHCNFCKIMLRWIRIEVGIIKKVLFVCHGNICRSPMAEFVFKELARRAGVAAEFEVDSVAVSAEELGNPIYPPAKAQLRSHGIPFDDHRARVLTRRDYDAADHLVVMDRSNLRGVARICGTAEKARLLLGDRDVSDPYYSGDFAQTWQDIAEGCRRLLAELTEA